MCGPTLHRASWLLCAVQPLSPPSAVVTLLQLSMLAHRHPSAAFAAPQHLLWKGVLPAQQTLQHQHQLQHQQQQQQQSAQAPLQLCSRRLIFCCGGGFACPAAAAASRCGPLEVGGCTFAAAAAAWRTGTLQLRSLRPGISPDISRLFLSRLFNA